MVIPCKIAFMSYKLARTLKHAQIKHNHFPKQIQSLNETTKVRWSQEDQIQQIIVPSTSMRYVYYFNFYFLRKILIIEQMSRCHLGVHFWCPAAPVCRYCGRQLQCSWQHTLDRCAAMDTKGERISEVV